MPRLAQENRSIGSLPATRPGGTTDLKFGCTLIWILPLPAGSVRINSANPCWLPGSDVATPAGSSRRRVASMTSAGTSERRTLGLGAADVLAGADEAATATAGPRPAG